MSLSMKGRPGGVYGTGEPLNGFTTLSRRGNKKNLKKALKSLPSSNKVLPYDSNGDEVSDFGLTVIHGHYKTTGYWNERQQ